MAAVAFQAEKGAKSRSNKIIIDQDTLACTSTVIDIYAHFSFTCSIENIASNASLSTRKVCCYKWALADQNDADCIIPNHTHIHLESTFLLLNTSSACEVRRSAGPPCWSPSPARSSRASGPSWPCPSGACWPVLLHRHHRTRTHPASTTPPT